MKQRAVRDYCASIRNRNRVQIFTYALTRVDQARGKHGAELDNRINTLSLHELEVLRADVLHLYGGRNKDDTHPRYGAAVQCTTLRFPWTAVTTAIAWSLASATRGGRPWALVHRCAA